MDHKAAARSLFACGVAAVQPEHLHYDVEAFRRQEITLLGSGKAVVGMAKALLAQGVRVKESFLVAPGDIMVTPLEQSPKSYANAKFCSAEGSRADVTIMVTPLEQSPKSYANAKFCSAQGSRADEPRLNFLDLMALDVPELNIFASSHPLPSARSVEAAEKLMKMISALNEDEVFIYLLSGGTSALVEKPIPPVRLEDFTAVSEALLQSGASIDEMNIVRKHLSMIKGGRLAALTKAKGKVFVISDVIGDDLEAIGSAPLFCDSSTCADAKRVLVQYGLWDSVNTSVRNLLEECSHETPKVVDPGIVHEVVASNKTALEAIAAEAEKAGYRAKIVTDRLRGDVRDVAKEIARIAQFHEADTPLCLLFGGETTVQVRGSGKGGRNQELALWVLKAMRGEGRFTFLSGGTDGRDGMSDAAGAVVDESDLHEDIDRYLDNNDSYHYHQKYGTLICTGASGTNVMDIMILIKE
ncbi:MAG: glycerate dehydrogenase [Sulfurospirillum sp.]|nr:MAG: glycerate dehydrogenase [Sulfurospirillum sp.]